MVDGRQQRTGVARGACGDCVPGLRAVTFDVGHTLLFPYPSVGSVYARVAARHGIGIAPDVAQERFLGAWRETQAEHVGLIYGTTHDEALAFWWVVLRKCFAGNGTSLATVRLLCDELYAEFAKADAWRLHDSWGTVRDACRRHGVAIGLVSNWDLRLRPLLDAFGLTEDADVVVISAEHGLEKPDSRIFELALTALGVGADQAAHVGDTWRDDVVAARQAGMGAVWYNPGNHPEPVPPVHGAVHIEHLTDLTDLLADGSGAQ